MKKRFSPRNNNRNNKRKNFPRKACGSNEIVRAILAKQTLLESNGNYAEKAYVSRYRFCDFLISDQLKKNIELRRYTIPTPIQDRAIPFILSGRDTIGIADTGTGKTAAFLIPLIDKVYKDKKEKVFIVTPTRELALQIFQELTIFAKGLGITSVLCTGGNNLHNQKQKLRKSPDFVIGTPGRLKDLIRRKDLDLSYFNTVVLDEVDRMVDIGFIDDVKYLISLLPDQRQSLFFSATVSKKVQEILRVFVSDPVTVSIDHKQASQNIDENIIRVSSKEKKPEQLQNLLTQKDFNKVLVFGRTKHGVEKLTKQLIKEGIKAGSIHGDKRQSQRQRVLEQFKHCEINVLLATDVASRGLDIKDVSHVINYDLPASYDDYIHRIGRTGRANKKGVALTFVD